MNKYVTEFIGTFFLVLTIGLAVANAGNLAPLAIGAVLMVMVYMGGHISGAHYNPAVTVAVFMRGGCPAKDVAPYMVAQIAGALVAALAAKFLTGSATPVDLGEGYSIAQGLTNEILYTFALALVVLNVATSKDHPNNHFYGLAIGFTVAVAAFAGGAISGGAYNPAVGLGHNIIAGNFGNIWLHVAGPVIGGALAAVVFRVMNPHEYE